MTRPSHRSAKRFLSGLATGLLVALCSAPATLLGTDMALGPDTVQSNAPVRGRVQAGDQSFVADLTSNSIPGKANQDRTSAAEFMDVIEVDAAEVPPPVCSGRGSLESIYFNDWTSGLGAWSVGTDNVANPATFDTEDWEAVAGLPDGRAGKAAFVANLDTGNCSDDDETGLLFLQSPTIVLPDDPLVPRVSFEHWFEIEPAWDGGNLKLSVNGGPFTLIPAAAIEFNTYGSTLNSSASGNSNPLASQPAYTGASGGSLGAWVQVRVNLLDLAEAGDSIRIRFEFGIDGCNGEVGWYVDDVRVYRCSDEQPPSDCGNEVLDVGEQCDDGNGSSGDGCSNTCQVETGWSCTEPLPPGEVVDSGFEAGTPNPHWLEASTNFSSPICNQANCDLGTGSGPASGDYWAWFGGTELYEESSLRQSVTIPAHATRLTFELEASNCDSVSDYLELRIGGIRKFLIDGADPSCGSLGYVTQMVDISEFADDGPHTLEFHAETFGINQDVSNFFVDDITIPGVPSICDATIFGSGFESN